MKKAKPQKVEELRPEYTRADFPGGFVRGKYAARIAKGSNIVVLEPEVASVFQTTESVNEALLSLIRVAKLASKPAKKSTRKTKGGTALVKGK